MLVLGSCWAGCSQLLGGVGCCRISNLPGVIAPPNNQGALPNNTLNAAYLKSVDSDGTLNHTITLTPGCNYTLSFYYSNLGARRPLGARERACMRPDFQRGCLLAIFPILES